ncbi:PREDICTED: reverse mRNAase [Prunus dulcis]|uniref:PREDICTED: reverse mRNAase n=1 Tax=Prunus dulcis TaxID=3755 RepID=A0A5E4GCI3_PRUDU|nr:PREDICTED: reverse mRNAase [Prunus dulcis]
MAIAFLSELDSLQQDWEENTMKIKEVERSLNQVWRCEELYWKQRAKTQWLKHGDANTAFFHNCTI